MSNAIDEIISKEIDVGDPSSGEEVDLNPKPQAKKDSKEKKPKQPKPKPVVDENTPYHMTPKGKRELQKLYDVGKPNPDYIRVPSGNGWKFIPKSEYEANVEKYEFKTKLREINDEKKSGNRRKRRRYPKLSLLL